MKVGYHIRHPLELSSLESSLLYLFHKSYAKGSPPPRHNFQTAMNPCRGFSEDQVLEMHLKQVSLKYRMHFSFLWLTHR